jgi:N-acyl-D-amino-acid deacylase
MKLIRVLTTCTALGIAMCAVSRPQPSPAQPFDIVITKGHIIDGTGSPWYSGDIGIRRGRIAAIGKLSAEPRKRTIDAHSEVVAPGFIDMLGQSSWLFRTSPAVRAAESSPRRILC